MLCGFNTGPTGTSLQTISASTEIPVPMTGYLTVPSGGLQLPFEYAASFVSRFPGSALWLNLSNIGSDDYVTTVASKVIANIGPTNDIILEHGNEHWNYADAFFEFGQELQESNFAAYMPTGTRLFGYYPTTNGATLPTDSGTSNTWYTLNAAHQFDVFQAAWVAAGLDPARLKRVYGSSWGSGGDTQVICSVITTYGLPSTYGIAVAPYQGIGGSGGIAPNDLTIASAFSPAGYPGYTNGNWPVDAINDFMRWILMYHSGRWSEWSSHAQHLPAGVRLVCYESSIDYLMPDQKYAVPNATWLAEDCLYHSSYYDVVRAYALFCQQGNPTVANSGAARHELLYPLGQG